MASRVPLTGRRSSDESVELRDVPVLHPKLVLLEHDVLALGLYDDDDDTDLAGDLAVAAPGARVPGAGDDE